MEENEYEEVILSADTGKVLIRIFGCGERLLGVDEDPDPEKRCRSIIHPTERQRKNIIEYLGGAI